MLKPPTCTIAAEVVASALLELGATNLAVKIGRHIAGRGVGCWETDGAVRAYLKRSDGRLYHRESIGRVRRLMTKRGWIGAKRIMPCGVMAKVKGEVIKSRSGTTSKWIAWDILGVRDPLTKGQRHEQRREQRAHQRSEDRRSAESSGSYRTGHRTIAPVFASLVQGIGGHPHIAPVVKMQGPAIAENRQRAAEDNAARQRAEFEAWLADNEPDPPDD